ncbi:MAG: PD40 domain-containing protein [Planctomycetota bacterium]|nr:MAG: PD40 domain-containing protein [Planctomycetota bacterium]
MRKHHRFLLGMLVLGALLSAALLYAFRAATTIIAHYNPVPRPPKIHPDYTGTAIPPNIAPLNFIVRESAARYCVRIHAKEGPPIQIQSRKPKIHIPIHPWKKLLAANRGRPLHLDVYTQDKTGTWKKFETITNTITNDEIDDYLVYRKIKLSVMWKDMGVYQRNLQNYDESIILHNSSFDSGCVNCHSFLNNSSSNMLTQVRSPRYGTPMLMAQNAEVSALNTRTKFTPGKVGFTAWHPNGRVIAFSINSFEMFFHTAAIEVRDVFSHASDLALYLIDSNKVLSTSSITRPDRLETFPEFSRDGRYLYFCSAPQLPVERYREVRCDLMRINYDPKTQKWGQLETVLSADKVQGSITQPRFSPDGRLLLFNVSEYSTFPTHQAQSDLYIMETETGQFRKLPISSNRCDAWHGFSSNGRWIVFSSKRLTGRFARPFFSHIDETGKAYKPFLLPQKDPTFYDSLLQVYNIPELISQPVPIKPKQLTTGILAYEQAPHADIVTGATPGLPPVPPHRPQPPSTYDQPWLQRE